MKLPPQGAVWERIKERRWDALVLSGGYSLSVLSAALPSRLTRRGGNSPPGGREAGVHHLVVGGEADVKLVSITHQVCRGKMTAVCA